MKPFLLLIFVTKIVFAEPLTQSAQWRDCIQSFKTSKSSFFDLVYNENDPKNHLLFRNGKSMAPEGLSVYHAGQFWHSEIKIADGFYAKKMALVVMGNEKFCLKQEFNWLRSDTMILTPYNEKTCANTLTYELSPAQGEDKPSVDQILAKKLVNDVNLGLRCLDGKKNEVGCLEPEKKNEYSRLLKWNTQACEKIDDSKIISLIAEKKRILGEFAAEYLPQTPPPPTKSKKATGTKS